MLVNMFLLNTVLQLNMYYLKTNKYYRFIKLSNKVRYTFLNQKTILNTVLKKILLTFQCVYNIVLRTLKDFFTHFLYIRKMKIRFLKYKFGHISVFSILIFIFYFVIQHLFKKTILNERELGKLQSQLKYQIYSLNNFMCISRVTFLLS